MGSRTCILALAVAVASAAATWAGERLVDGWTEFTPGADSRLVYVSKAGSPVALWSASSSYAAGSVVVYPVSEQEVAGPIILKAFWRASGAPAQGVAPGVGVAGWTETADPGVVYHWNGSQVVDSLGNTYGSDPFNPLGVRTFYCYGTMAPAVSAWANLRPGYADWCLFRRGETWTAGVDAFRALEFVDGRSAAERTLHGAWGPVGEARPVFVFRRDGLTGMYGNHPSSFCSGGFTGGSTSRGNYAFCSMVFVQQDTANRGGGVGIVAGWEEPIRLGNVLFEDLWLDGGTYGFGFQWLGSGYNIGVALRRCAVSNVWNASSHNQGCYVSKMSGILIEDCAFDRNGYKGDPRTVDTARDIFSRNFYLATYEQMGLTMRGTISCNGGSGGPQMRSGGLIEQSLVLNEGYWFTASGSNGYTPPWVLPQQGVSALIRDNVMFKWRAAGTANDASHPGWGLAVQGASFGVQVQGNIITGRHMVLDGQDNGDQHAIKFEGVGTDDTVSVENTRNCVRDNICYLAGPLDITPNRGLPADSMVNNVVATPQRVLRVAAASAVRLSGNHYYTGQAAAFRTPVDDRTYAQYVAEGVTADDGSSTVAQLAQAAATEGWPAPDRSVRSYMDSLGFPVTTADGVREFMQETCQQRKGYWRPQFTAAAVVDYIREGFGMSRLMGVAPGARAAQVAPLRAIRCASPYRAGSPIVCRVTQGSDVRVSVHDLLGRPVRCLYQGRAAGGRELSLAWDGRDQSGRSVVAATYIVRLAVGGTVQCIAVRFL